MHATTLLILGSSIALNLLLYHYLKSAQRRIHQLCHCPTYGIYTRQGIDIAWQHLSPRRQQLALIFLDIDNMGEANRRWGYAEIDRRIAAAFRQTRSTERAGRWYSGDEIVLLVPTCEAGAAAQRLQNAFLAQGLSATFAITPCPSPDLAANVKIAADLVQQLKSEGLRGTLIFSQKTPQFC